MTNAEIPQMLIVEDEPDWQEIYQDDAKREGFRVTVVDSVPKALRILKNGDTYFHALLVDKGDNVAIRTGPDIIAHLDGLDVLRTSFEVSPDTIRILATGEFWEPSVFVDNTIGLHVFIDKGWYADNRREMFSLLRQWNRAPTLPYPIVLDQPNRKSYEYDL